ncbi:alpha/beta hydrolase [Streptomyces sp. NBC_00510]
MVAVHHLTAAVADREVFYREAGPRDAPVVVLLHGFPASSHMFRHLIPLLADRYRVVAPDHIGFGRSSMPSLQDFPYSFDALAGVTAALLDRLGVGRHALYVHGYGAAIGWRLALRAPARITGIVTQNGNAYAEGLVDSFWSDVRAYAADPSPGNEKAVRYALTPDAVRWRYLNGVPDPGLVSPDTWAHDVALLQRPGNDEIQLRLFRDHTRDVDLHPALHEYFRASQVPLVAVWGANDEVYAPAGARAFLGDLPEAEVHLLDTGHFALESHLDAVAGYVRGFLGRVVP